MLWKRCQGDPAGTPCRACRGAHREAVGGHTRPTGRGKRLWRWSRRNARFQRCNEEQIVGVPVGEVPVHQVMEKVLRAIPHDRVF